MPPEFWFPDPQTDYWLALPNEAALGTAWEAPVIARIVPSSALGSATAELRELAARENLSLKPGLREYSREVTDPLRPALRNLQRAVVLLLLLACVNLAWMQSARAVAARGRYAILGALGATPGGLILNRLSEILVLVLLAVPGAAAGAWVVVRYAAAHGAVHAPRLAEASVTLHALLLAAAGALTILLTASVPALLIALHASRQQDLLHRSDAPRRPVGELPLMVAQAAAVVALSMQALVLALDLRAVLGANVGFERTDSVVLAFSVSEGDPAVTIGRLEEMRASLEMDAVEAAITSAHPLSGRETLINVSRTRAEKLAGNALMAGLRAVSPNYLEFVGMNLASGRMFGSADLERPTVIINEPLARRMCGSIDCARETIHLGDLDFTIVGVVKAVRHRGLFEEPQPAVYVLYPFVARASALAASSVAGRFFVVAPEARGVKDTIRLVRVAAEREIPAATLEGGWHFRDLVSQAAGERPFVLHIVSGVAVVALVLMALGCYGMLVHAAIRRGREIAIRIVLGASSSKVIGEILRPVAVVWTAGCVFGFVIFALLGRSVGAELLPEPASGVPTRGVAVAASVILLIALLLASVRPVLTAVRVDLTSALRSE